MEERDNNMDKEVMIHHLEFECTLSEILKRSVVEFKEINRNLKGMKEVLK